MEGKTNSPRPLKQVDGLNWLTPIQPGQIYATDWKVPEVKFKLCQVLVVVRDLVVLAPLLTSLENSQNTARKSTRSRLAYVRRPHELSLWPLDFTLSYNTGSSVPNSNRFCLQFVNHKRPKLVRTRNGELLYSMPRALSVAGGRQGQRPGTLWFAGSITGLSFTLL